MSLCSYRQYTIHFSSSMHMCLWQASQHMSHFPDCACKRLFLDALVFMERLAAHVFMERLATHALSNACFRQACDGALRKALT